MEKSGKSAGPVSPVEFLEPAGARNGPGHDKKLRQKKKKKMAEYPCGVCKQEVRTPGSASDLPSLFFFFSFLFTFFLSLKMCVYYSRPLCALPANR